jgi:putative PIN family toxin of toxin-antitoxin system
VSSRVILDTNVVISGFLWQGAPNRVLKAVSSGRITGFSSLQLLEELLKTLSYPKFSAFFASGEHTPAKLVALYESFINVVVPQRVNKTLVIADPSDDIVVTTAFAAEAEFIVTGNKHLLDLDHKFGFRIILPAMLLKKL